ncbi:MAG: hypothetical protein FJX35_01290 [Alphaproteobacteria bacterium]|nr:hypothetical protein [Alphaproteobacteria bacterium]
MFRRIRRLVLTAVALVGASAAMVGGPVPALAQGGKVVLAIPQEPTTFQPYFFSIAFYHLYNQFYNVLVRLDPDQKAQPELAESWQLSPDGLK